MDKFLLLTGDGLAERSVFVAWQVCSACKGEPAWRFGWECELGFTHRRFCEVHIELNIDRCIYNFWYIYIDKSIYWYMIYIYIFIYLLQVLPYKLMLDQFPMISKPRAEAQEYTSVAAEFSLHAVPAWCRQAVKTQAKKNLNQEAALSSGRFSSGCEDFPHIICMIWYPSRGPLWTQQFIGNLFLCADPLLPWFWRYFGSQLFHH